MRRRTVFAAPFVIVAAGCGGRTYVNPPPPRSIPIEECRALTEGAPCKATRDPNGQRDASYCSIEAENPKCGLQGYSCNIGPDDAYVWHPVILTSNECPAPPVELGPAGS
jgi:hypothetical protein